MSNKGLNDYRVLSSDERSILQNKINTYAKLNERWDEITHKQYVVRTKEEIVNDAEHRNKESLNAIKEVEDILLHTLGINDAVDWDQLKDKSRFGVPNPEGELPGAIAKVQRPSAPVKPPDPAEPSISTFPPSFTFLDGLLKSKREAKLNAQHALYLMLCSRLQGH